MALNIDVVGKQSEPVEFNYDNDRVILYALGAGEGVENLGYVYEKDLKVLPTFGVIPITPCIGKLIRGVNVNFRTMLHAEQKLTLHKPIPPAGTILTTGSVESIYDKGDKGAVINIKTESTDADGKLLFENIMVLFDRSGGNFGGDRGPKTTSLSPPEGAKADVRVEYSSSSDQALLYRLSGDKNPLHADPEFAKMAGFDRPILMGLCTFGFAGRAVLHSLCDSDPGRFKSLSTRFVGSVYPGDTIITEAWNVSGSQYAIQTSTQDGRVVLANAVAEIG